MKVAEEQYVIDARSRIQDMINRLNARNLNTDDLETLLNLMEYLITNIDNDTIITGVDPFERNDHNMDHLLEIIPIANNLYNYRQYVAYYLTDHNDLVIASQTLTPTPQISESSSDSISSFFFISSLFTTLFSSFSCTSSQAVIPVMGERSYGSIHLDKDLEASIDN